MRDAFRFGEDGSEVVVVAGFHARYLSGINVFLVLQEHRVVDRRQRLVVEHLGTLHYQVLGTHLQVFLARLQFLHCHYGLATLLHGEEIDHGRGLVLVVVEGLHRHFGKEGEGALRTHHRMRHDVEWVVVGKQRTKVEARHVLDAVFQSDAVRQFLVGTHTVAQCFNLLDKLRMTLAEFLLALLVAGIHDGAVGQYQAGAHHHPVAVGMHTTVHARGIVYHNTANHGAADGSRVGREHTAIGLQDFVHPGANNARLQFDGVLVGTQFVFLPILSCHDKYGVSTTLPRQ